MKKNKIWILIIPAHGPLFILDSHDRPLPVEDIKFLLDTYFGDDSALARELREEFGFLMERTHEKSETLDTKKAYLNI